MVEYPSRHHVSIIALLIALNVSASSCRREASQPKEVATYPPASSPEPKVITNAPIFGSGNVLSTSVMFHDDAGQLNMTDVFLLINDRARGADGNRRMCALGSASNGRRFPAG